MRKLTALPCFVTLLKLSENSHPIYCMRELRQEFREHECVEKVEFCAYHHLPHRGFCQSFSLSFREGW